MATHRVVVGIAGICSVLAASGLAGVARAQPSGTPSVAARDGSQPEAASGSLPARDVGFPEAQPARERRIPDLRFVFGNLLVFRWNPLGLEDQIRTGVQVRLFKSFDQLSRDNFVFFGIAPKINP